MAQPNESVRRLASTAVGAALSCMDDAAQGEIVGQLLASSSGDAAAASGGSSSGPIGKRTALYGALRYVVILLPSKSLYCDI